jgi:hypothetical protein
MIKMKGPMTSLKNKKRSPKKSRHNTVDNEIRLSTVNKYRKKLHIEDTAIQSGYFNGDE